jgi:hypothetical protein
MEKRHAILLCGFCRDYKENLDKFKATSRNRENVDLFISFWDVINSHPKEKLTRYEDLNKINLDEIVSDYSPTDIKIFEWAAFEDMLRPMAHLVQEGGLVGPNSIYAGDKDYNIVMRTVATSFLIKQSFNLLERYGQRNNIEYVNILRTRTEFGYYNLGGYYPTIDWDKDYSSAIYIPNWNFLSRGGYPQISCSGALSNFDNMKVYCNLLENLPSIARRFTKQPRKCWGDEYCYSLYLSQNNIPWKVLK